MAHRVSASSFSKALLTESRGKPRGVLPGLLRGRGLGRAMVLLSTVTVEVTLRLQGMGYHPE